MFEIRKKTNAWADPVGRISDARFKPGRLSIKKVDTTFVTRVFLATARKGVPTNRL